MQKGDKFTEYEWLLETIDKNDDVIDIWHFDKFKDAIKLFGKNLDKGQIRIDVSLRQRVWRHQDLDDQYYNYLQLNKGLWKMAEYFPHWDGEPTGFKVPKRFFKELDTFNNKQS